MPVDTWHSIVNAINLMNRLLLLGVCSAFFLSPLSGQTLAEALDIDDSSITVTSTDFAVSTTPTDSYDGEDAVTATLTSTTKYINLTFASDGIFTVRMKLLTGTSGVNVNLQTYINNWSNVTSLSASSSSWSTQSVFVRKNRPYRISAYSYSGASPQPILGIDTMSLEPLPEGDLAGAADTDLTLANTGNNGLWVASPSGGVDSGDVLQAYRAAELSTTVTGPALLSFAWRTSSTYNDAYVVIAGHTARSTSSTEWKYEQVIVPAGSSSVRWYNSFYSYSSTPATTPLAYLDDLAITPLQTSDINEALDTEDILFKPGTALGWLDTGPESSVDGEDAFGASASGSENISTIEGVLEGPAVLRFYWSNYNMVQALSVGRLRAFLLSWQTATTSSSDVWEPEEVLLSPGLNHLRWAPSSYYYSSGYRESRLDNITIDKLAEIPLPTALDVENLEFTSGPEGAEWWGQDVITWDFTDAAASGNTLPYGYSWMQTVVDGPGVVSYRWRRASEGSDSYFRFYLMLGQHLPGEVNWTTAGSPSSSASWTAASIAIPAGRHQVAWMADAFNGTNGFSDFHNYYFVDQVRFTPSATAHRLRASTRINDTWMWSPWLGDYATFTQNANWIYHESQGWMELRHGSDANIYFFYPSMNAWCVTSEAYFPFFRCLSNSTWYRWLVPEAF